MVIIGFSSDIGFALGDTKEHCRFDLFSLLHFLVCLLYHYKVVLTIFLINYSVYHGARWHAAIIFVVGFWILDFSNNSVQVCLFNV